MKKKSKHKNKISSKIILFVLIIILIVFGVIYGKKTFKKDIEVNLVEYEESKKANNVINSKNHNTDKEQKWNLILVNRWNPIPQNYKVELVQVAGGEKVDKRIYEPLMKMLEDAKEKNWGKDPIIVSGYRTKEKQKQLYEEKIESYKKKGYSKKEAVKETEKWVSNPGYSEHQLRNCSRY